jgi:alpha-glucosidase
VRAEIAAMQAAGTPIAGVWLQDWTGQRTTSFGDRLWWTWQLDEQRYPGWADLVADLAAEGIRTTTYVNTWLVDAAPKGDPTIRNLWAEARDAGFLVESPEGGPYLMDQGGFDASLVDLTDPAARRWFASVIADQVLADGVVGFMADFGEGAPFDGVYHEGTGELVHNRWPALWAQTVQEGCALAGQPECVAWVRSGALGQEEHAPLFWNGDQLVTFGAEDGLASALLGTFSAGVSGWPLVHSDVGGYTSVNALVKDYVRSPELLARWAEFEAFGVVMRTHEGNRPARNLQVFSTPETAATFARMARLHAALAEYRSAVVREATRTGVPALRHSWVNHPGTAAARSDRQFFLGDSLLVAPVMDGGDTVEVVLPPGTWVHLLTGQAYPGDQQVTVAAPIGTPAAFVPADDPVGTQLRAAVAGAGLA